MNNTQFSRLRRECFLHPHKQHPWNKMTSRSERHTETSAKVPFPCRGVSCQLSRHFSVAVTAAWQRRVFFCFFCSLVHGKWSEECTSTRQHHPWAVTSPLGSAVKHTELPECSHSWHKITGLGTALQLVHGKSNASLRESLLSPPHPISVRHYKYHVTQAPCAALHVLQSRRGLQVLDAASTMRSVCLLAVLLEVALVQWKND